MRAGEFENLRTAGDLLLGDLGSPLRVLGSLLGRSLAAQNVATGGPRVPKKHPRALEKHLRGLKKHLREPEKHPRGLEDATPMVSH